MALSNKDLERFSPAAKRQILQQLGAQQRQKEHKAKGNKYNAKPTDVVMPDGSVKRFDSEKEANRYRELAILEKAGRISNLRTQVTYELLPRQRRADGTWEQPVKYIADFEYRDAAGRKVVEDVKGYADPKSAAYKAYTVKRKMMLYFHGITIKEV